MFLHGKLARFAGVWLRENGGCSTALEIGRSGVLEGVGGLICICSSTSRASTLRIAAGGVALMITKHPLSSSADREKDAVMLSSLFNC